ncbi:type I restriction-modification system subunit M [Brevibacillus centrosporus]|uniref:type I restriction-modification system subunit M n=1 Tax=Brevibacillus centrosporus TaxID=54910 RepID=UPI0039864D49
MLQNNKELKSKIDQLWIKFWSGGISNPLTAIEQITYLLFMKRLDDLDIKRKAEADLTGEAYTSKFEGKWLPIGMHENEGNYVEKEILRWSHFRHLPAEERLQHIQLNVFPFLKALNGEESPFTYHMKNAVFIIPKPALLVEAMSIIEEIFELIEKDAIEGGQAFQDIQGDVYEMLLSEISTAGKNGQFRTPRHIIKLIVELVGPQFGDRVADPACGSGGFLLGAYQYLVTQLVKDSKDLKLDEDGFLRGSVSSQLTKEESDILNNSLYGFDIDVTMVRLGLMNLMMHGVDNPNIDYKDTLSKGFTESDSYHIIMANPPFTGSIDKGDINESLQLSTTKTELLFIENIYNLLKMGGTAGVIVPQGVLFSSGKAFIDARKILVEKCELKAVITMPSGVFKPYAGVSTAILIFTKGGNTKNIWFYNMQNDGYSLDDKRTKLEGNGDLQDIIKQFKKRDPYKDKDRKAKCFFVPKQEIIEGKYDLSISRYKEEEFEEIVYEKPEAILANLKDMERVINKELAELEGLLG